MRAPAALKLNLSADTLLALPLSRDRVASLKQAVNTLQQTLADKAKAERPKRWPMMEWRVKVGTRRTILRAASLGAPSLASKQAHSIQCRQVAAESLARVCHAGHGRFRGA